MTNATKTQCDYLLNFTGYMKHKMQITQKRWAYDLKTNSIKFIQQTCNKRLYHCQKETVVFVTNTYCSPPT